MIYCAFLIDPLPKFGSTKDAISRQKRGLLYSFEDKHIWEYNPESKQVIEEDVRQRFEYVNKTYNRRDIHTFIATTKKGQTKYKLNQIINEKYKHEPPLFDVIKDKTEQTDAIISFTGISVNLIHAILIQVSTNADVFRCGFAYTGHFSVYAFDKTTYPLVYHFASTPNIDEFTRCKKYNEVYNQNTNTCKNPQGNNPK